ncbi:3-oxoacid CoA-transferase subunit B [Desulfosediminicola flagellatus]|uniref:3-oxoacid CoA-transferase subunit B n=1 Tax=Desulfosediminicola flagellatus TaxID=2569541 RepID=UPI0010AD0C33|nr:3-oxoacid CoA-transferase subunit B [Desulfosediminicola flagellatus]
MSVNPKEKIARRAAQEITAGQVVNLGIGIPTLIPSFLPPDLPIIIHSENGIIGAGEIAPAADADRNLIDAGGSYISVVSGAAYCDSALSFALVRGGRLDLTFLGALEVSERGDLANWIIPGKFAPGIGGAMELAQKARKLVITTTHTTRKGEPKILKECTLPLTASDCVKMIITELAVIAVTPTGMILKEIAEETDLETVLRATEASLTVADNLLRF